MAQQDYTAILLRSVDKNESDKTIKILTASHGIKTCLLKGVKKHAAKLKVAGMPFACGIYSLTDKGNVVTGFVSLHEFDWVTRDYDVFVAASLGLEVIEQASLGSDSSQAMVLLLGFLKSLLKTEPKLAIKEFATSVLEFLGYKKDYSKYSHSNLIGELEDRLVYKFASTKLIAK